MFQQQTLIQQALPAVRQLMAAYNQPDAALDAIEHDAHNFIVRVPLIGAFSSGKSSLLNALLGEVIFATSISPETAIPAEISYAASESFTGHAADGRTIAYSREAVRENQLHKLQSGGWLEVKLPCERLTALPHFHLVDMPGWDSGIAVIQKPLPAMLFGSYTEGRDDAWLMSLLLRY